MVDKDFGDLGPQSVSDMTHPEVPDSPEGTTKTKEGQCPTSWKSPSFPKIVGIVLQLISILNYPAYKTNPCHILQPHKHSATVHTLSMECFSQDLNKSTSLPISLCLLTEFFLHEDIKNLSFIWP